MKFDDGERWPSPSRELRREQRRGRVAGSASLLALAARGFPAMLAFVAPSHNSLRSLRSLCSNTRALRRLTRRICLSAVSAANVASYATRPRGEHRKAVGAKRRPLHHEPLPGSACRDALNFARPFYVSRVAHCAVDPLT